MSQSKRLEQLLRSGFAAEGRGLHELVTSVEPQLPTGLVRRLRFIATVRNRLVHESAGDRVDDLDGFLQACATADAELRRLISEGRSATRGAVGPSTTVRAIRHILWWGAIAFLVGGYVIGSCTNERRATNRPAQVPESPIIITPR